LAAAGLEAAGAAVDSAAADVTVVAAAGADYAHRKATPLPRAALHQPSLARLAFAGRMMLAGRLAVERACSKGTDTSEVWRPWQQ
jgi:hypothetical protein